MLRMELLKMKSVGSDEVSDLKSDSSCDPRWWRRLKAGCVTRGSAKSVGEGV